MDLSTLEAFADAMKAKFALPGPASPEDQLKPVVAGVLQSAGAAYGLTVETRTEAHLADRKVRPDIAVYAGGLICGYIELKAPGLGADAPKLKGEHNRKQWEKLKGLPNLIYTDGREWALYRGGERPDGQPVVRLHDDPAAKGKSAVAEGDAAALERLFRDFLGWRPAVPHNPSGLAQYLAPLSRFLRSEVENALGQPGSAVELLASEWRQFFFPDAGNAIFADAYAQTVTYAMLLARLSGAAKLDPAEAARTLDKNNGLLARALELLGHPDARKELAVGFEMLVGPYAVAHLRLTQALEGAMNGAKAADEPEEKLASRLNIYLADTLESPNAAPPGGLTLTYRALTQEHEAARKVKNAGDILVCLGNPPYDRQTIGEDDTATQRKGGWVRFGDQVKGAAKQEEQGGRPIFRDFTEPAAKAGAGVHLKNLYNDYVYFWRWALWRLFEQQKCGGIVTFITASSYLAGPGFVGMREMMRRAFDEIWIVDLGGDSLGARKTPNVFNIQTPVAIAIGVRGAKPDPDTPARVRYARIEGATREDKLARLDAIAGFDGAAWRDCPDDWGKPFLPIGKGDYFAWPEIGSIFPLTLNGAQFKRHWPIGETTAVLTARWERLRTSKPAERKKLFRETDGWRITKTVRDELPGQFEPSVSSLTETSASPAAVPFAYRSFDRRFALYDFRLGDRLRPVLWRLHSDKQVYMTTLLSYAPGLGQGMVACAMIPDLHHFRGSFGGKDVIPLYRDAAGNEPNVTGGLLDALGAAHGAVPSAEDLAAYVYAVLGGQSYTRRFWNELETPGPRIPLTRDGVVFAEAAKLGRKLIWLHTYAERFGGEGRGGEIPPGAARVVKGVSGDPAKYPETFAYDPAAREIAVGDGRFGPVAPDVWAFEVSGLKAVQSWLGYRMKVRAGKKSSPLDDIRPERWTARMSDELLELLWVLEATLAMEPELEKTLDGIVAGPCFTAAELPAPRPWERKAPGTVSAAGGLLEMMGVEDDDAGDDENGEDDEDGG